MAKQAAASVGIEAMALGSVTPNYDMPSDAYGIAQNSLGIHETYDHAQWLRERISEITGMSKEDRARRLAAIQPSALDPDLAVNRSMSLQHKVREQKRRLLERSLEADHFSLKRELANYVKQALS